jgi:micrococcal nuclease
MESARVVHIVDGDTLDVDIGGRKERVRLFGVDTPERGDRCFDEASEALRLLAGQDVLLRPDARERDRFGRLLRYLYRTDGSSIDAALIDEGLALAWTADGALRDPLVALETRAREQHAGCLWR